jgi:hypothetical protein
MPSPYHQGVRTTLTLDDDVAAALKGEMRNSGASFKAAVNECLRAGLRARRTPPPRTEFKIREIGLRVGGDYGNIGELIERLDGPLHR